MTLRIALVLATTIGLIDLAVMVADRIGSLVIKRRLARHEVWLVELDRDLKVFADDRPTLRQVNR